MEEATTQLADTRPLLDYPLRMTIPVNVPARASKPSHDAELYQKAFSPAAQVQAHRHKQQQLQATHTHSMAPLPQTLLSSMTQSSSSRAAVPMEHDAQLKNLSRDFAVLATSSRRSGKKDVEATAYASLGVLCDNQEDYKGGIEYYAKYLRLCEEIGDAMGISAACNCIGVNNMFLAMHCKNNSNANSSNSNALTQMTSLKSAQASQEAMSDEKREFLQQAIIAHTRHLDVSPDIGGKFIAHVNLGVCLSWLGDVNQAAKNQQDALRVAIKMQTLYGQSIAVGNLGLLALNKRDFHTARTCFDQHLQLIQALLDPEAEIAAWKLLAELSKEQDDFIDSLESLEQARRIAERENLLNELRSINCLIGVVRGTVQFRQYTQSLSLQQPKDSFNNFT